MERQYIGARYVPKFFEYNGGNWIENTEYEPLTIVQYNGNSYTSKKPVPSNVGNPSSNPDYWASTGNYNAQVEAYRQEVEAYKEEVEEVKNTKVTNLANRKFIFVADSYGVYGWTANVINRLNLDGHALNVSGAGFVTPSNDVTFLVALENYASTLSQSEKENITDIIVLAGINDYVHSKETIKTAISNFIITATSLFPNAKIGGGCLSWINRNNDCAAYISNVIPAYNEEFNKHSNSYYISDASLPMHKYDNMQEDGLHPNTNGTKAITDYICNYLLTGNANYLVENSVTYTPVNSTGSINIKTIMDKNGIDIIFVPDSVIVFDEPIQFNNFLSLHTIGNISGGCIVGNAPTITQYYPSISFSVPAIFNATGASYNGSVNVSINNGNVSISANIGDYPNYPNINNIQMCISVQHVSLLTS